jgi:hypothetical protein
MPPRTSSTKRALEKDAVNIGFKFKVSYYVALPILIIIILAAAGYLVYTQVITPEDANSTATALKGLI